MPAIELITDTIGLPKPNRPPGALRWAAARRPGASQRRSLKCNSEQMVTMAAENASAVAPLRMTRDGAGRGRCLLAATRSGTARPVTVARALSARRGTPRPARSSHQGAPVPIAPHRNSSVPPWPLSNPAGLTYPASRHVMRPGLLSRLGGLLADEAGDEVIHARTRAICSHHVSPIVRGIPDSVIGTRRRISYLELTLGARIRRPSAV
jgi:hypothetical protein